MPETFPENPPINKKFGLYQVIDVQMNGTETHKRIHIIINSSTINIHNTMYKLRFT